VVVSLGYFRVVHRLLTPPFPASAAGTVNKSPEERQAGVVHHEPQEDSKTPSSAQE
jgi:hypothetical protein